MKPKKEFNRIKIDTEFVIINYLEEAKSELKKLRKSKDYFLLCYSNKVRELKEMIKEKPNDKSK